jgi:hypothetical protein
VEATQGRASLISFLEKNQVNEGPVLSDEGWPFAFGRGVQEAVTRGAHASAQSEAFRTGKKEIEKMLPCASMAG